jgi:plastocyanin
LSFKKHCIVIVLPIILASTIYSISTTTTDIFAQTVGSMTIPQNIDATYAISIVPGAAQKENVYHYYPPSIAVPIDTTISWFNNDFGQPHTVTSGQAGSEDSGVFFNSGIMPATANSFFQYTFTEPGEFPYHCNIHPWRVASVSVSNAFFTGEGFKIDLGSGGTWDLSKTPRVLLDIEPQTIPLDKNTPITYNVTINDGENNQKLFSNLFTTAGESLPIELVAGESSNNETRSYGPDFSSRGAYHILLGSIQEDSTYPMNIEIVSVNSKPVESPIKVVYDLKTS